MTPSPATPDTASSQPSVLGTLRGLRSAPRLSETQASRLRLELAEAVGQCPWFTIGVMASSASAALEALKRFEAAFGWSALVASAPEQDDVSGGVFLKGNQRTGTYLLRHEEGLGEGVLISGQNPENPALTDTWGPLPLDLY